jgi:central kinetochore subunit Mal2/MCM21
MKSVERLRHRRSLLANTLLSNRKIRSHLNHAKTTVSPSFLPSVMKALKQEEIQAHANISNLYRTCSGITVFRVQDPDPNAIDSGSVLGVQIEVFATNERRFISPYYVLFNKPEADDISLKIHKHTIPTFIPIQQLAAKYLPLPDPAAALSTRQPSQNLPAFIRALRRELVSHHKRLSALTALKANLPPRHSSRLLDSSGNEFEIELSNGSIARLKLSTDGKIENAIVRAKNEARGLTTVVGNRQRETERAILGGNRRVEELMDRLTRSTG